MDEDGNCRDTRAEVLIASSTGRVHMRKNGCSVDRGKWFDPYTGKTFTQASDVDIDHLVPLAWADAIGLSQVVTTLANLGASYGEDRYRISPLLRRKIAASRAEIRTLRGLGYQLVPR